MTFRGFVFYRGCHFITRQFHSTNSIQKAVRKKIKSEGYDINALLRKMPKPKKVDVKLRHVKFREKIGSRIPVPSTVEIQVIGSGGRGTPRAVMIATDHTKYLFNCGEGTQRIASEHKMKITKLENIFVTHKSWENIGGLLGMALTLESANVPEIKIHGPPGVEAITKMVRAFADAASVKLEKRELSEGSFEDFAMKIDYVPLHRKITDESPSKDSTLHDQSQLTEEPALKKRRLSTNESNVAVAYICKPHPAARKVLLEKCVEVGIKAGPILGKLTAGESVTLDNGTVVHPDQVLSPKEETQPFVVVECPDEEFLEAVTTSPQLLAVTNGGCELVVHMSPPHIVDTEQYQQWMNSFGEDTKHLIINSTTSEVSQVGLYRIQSQLNLVSPQVFPLLPHLSLPPVGDDSSPGEGEAEECTKMQRVVKGSTNLKYQYRPKRGFNREHCLQLDRAAYVNEALELPDLKQLLSDLKPQVEHRQKETPHTQYPEIVFLGTGSSVPSKSRNASAIVVNLSPDTSMLLDCGEGTAGQLFRHYGPQTDDVLRKLKAVFISHLHADHHLGLFSVVAERGEAFKKAGVDCPKLLLLAPAQIARWLDFYTHEVDPVKEQLRFFSLQSLLSHQQEVNVDTVKLVHSQLHLDDFLPVEVQHCKNAFGIALVHKQGWKLVYSGDTVPCERLVIAGENCDLLIHEATMEDDLEEEAKFKRHSTTSQAIDIGVRMRAKFILLTHFSQRYAKIPVFSEKFTNKVGISFDNMRVSLSDLPLLPLFNAALKALFVDEYNDLVEKGAKRTMKKTLMKEIMGKQSSATTSEKDESKTVESSTNSPKKAESAAVT